MQTLSDLPALRAAIAALKSDGKPLALVPTMGALHDGHMALVEEARRHGRHVVVSIFVNPKQFGPNEDLAAYPRREAKDAQMLSAAGVDILWAPTVDVMYPAGFATNISVSGVSEGLDGAARPGHFDGVATVVTKLFNQVRPDVAIFGEKDYQQLAVIRQMVADLDLGIEIIGLPTQRAQDGLALSSRNAYLNDEERKAALALPRALGEAKRQMEKGGSVEEALTRAGATLIAQGFDPVDYVMLCDAVTLEPMHVLDRPARLLGAAKLGRTRLIDNIAVDTA
ncbi:MULTISPECIES: pantoate--beta-alanine ligase [unclassified Sphingobium]|uniref:pantoate--beta-alanine ligase n=1 Tax=unclassified Sphingobium TaxID=2611147 RepID=UPI000D17AD25|nr:MULTISPECIES: pantoate--beta-alanine ligase [unclassified Sphingobium]MBG6118262.1 pantoate--beta-alanine ligase [Sphingobium sp. JAI105]PSO11546.1 pantoate--beta-alanine ligase [Sphingobium sp. AEW4]TWD07843.1 pantothenate synthetase [Sphingobium sp. AEW010]TWD24887.1 pantothenate synthetase [Sphingobium sp. AEW013]TWD26695.1 pantothenate synthetase [Sphingobium sp. AEW001]